MELITYIQRGGIIVDVLIFMNIIGFTIMLWKTFIFFMANKNIYTISDEIINNIKHSSHFQVAQIQSLVEFKVKSLESGLNTVKLIASISPLIGLLGTVIGILNSFDSISHMGLNDPTIFSGGISVALITTVAGLIVAIPHYIGYNYFIGTLDNMEIKLEKIILEKI